MMGVKGQTDFIHHYTILYRQIFVILFFLHILYKFLEKFHKEIKLLDPLWAISVTLEAIKTGRNCTQLLFNFHKLYFLHTELPLQKKGEKKNEKKEILRELLTF